jgi:endonuclease-3
MGRVPWHLPRGARLVAVEQENGENTKVKMVTQKEIGTVMGILKNSVKKFENPIATEIGETTRSPYMVLVSCLLSLRSMDKVTGPVSRKLFEVADTPHKMARLPLRRLQSIIKPVNYYKTKAKRIKEISKRLVERCNGNVPGDFDGLMALKGVGRKTANIVMTYGHFKKGHLPIDTHCHRIPNRLGWIRTKTPEQTEEALKRLLPKRYWRDFNDMFVMWGQNICLPVSPKCSICPIEPYCEKKGVTRHR